MALLRDVEGGDKGDLQGLIQPLVQIGSLEACSNLWCFEIC